MTHLRDAGRDPRLHPRHRAVLVHQRRTGTTLVNSSQTSALTPHPPPPGSTPALTAQQQASEQVVVPGCRVAVPAVDAELVLALRDPVLHAGPDGLHHFGVLAAQLALLVHQAGDVVAHHLGAQGAHVPAHTQEALNSSAHNFQVIL